MYEKLVERNNNATFPIIKKKKKIKIVQNKILLHNFHFHKKMYYVEYFILQLLLFIIQYQISCLKKNIYLERN